MCLLFAEVAEQGVAVENDEAVGQVEVWETRRWFCHDSSRLRLLRQHEAHRLPV